MVSAIEDMRLFLTYILFSCCLLSEAQTTLIPEMKFRRLDTPDGLSSSQINCIFKDSHGFVWFGTPYGLNRYDGYRIKTYYSNKRDTTTLRDNYVDQVYEAHDGRLWLKQGMSYCVYDPVTEKFERNAQRALAKYGINGGIERLYIDSKKNFWVKLYEDGIYYYNPKTKRLHVFKLGYEKNQYNPTYGLSWFAEYGSKVIATTNCGEMICFDGERGTIDWESTWMREHGGPANQNYELTIDKEGNYWVVSNNKTFIYMKSENRWYGTLNEFMEAHGFTNIPADMQVWGIIVDNHGWVWAAVDHQGIIVFDYKHGQMRQFLSNKYDPTTISENAPRHIYQAPDGSVWIGTYKNGINQYIESLSSFKSVELGDINTVCEDRYGNYWIGTNDQGILVYDPKTGSTVNHFTAENSGLSSNIMVGSWPASDGSIWFGSYNGGLVHCIPSAAVPTEATIVNYRSDGSDKGLANNSVWALTEDRWKRIWFTTLGGGVQVLDPKTNEFRTWNAKNTTLPSDYLTTINWTKKGWLLLGTSYYYALLNPVSNQLVTQALPEDPTITVNISNSSYIIEDSRGIIWQGSTSGVTFFDPKTKFMRLLDMSDGLYGSSVNSIVEDRQHSIWVVTDHGVSRIKPQRQEDGTWQFVIRSFNSTDGLQTGTYNQRSTWVTRGGLLLVGGQGGLDIINPATVVNTRSKEKPVFCGLQLFDQDVQVGHEIDGRVILDRALNVCQEITLRFNDQFTIQLGSDAGSIRNTKRFAYMLEGFNDNWVKTSPLNPNITYNSLRAGDYVLHVRMLNEDGTLGTEERTLEITIMPALWRTRWAMALYVLLVAMAALFWRSRFLKRHKERAELEHLRQVFEKRQWASEIRHQIIEEQKQHQGQPSDFVQEQEHAKVVVRQAESDLIETLRQLCKQYVVPEGKRAKVFFFPSVDTLEMCFDKKQIEKAISILITNSIRFSMRYCKVKVFVDDMGSNAVIRVSDTGIGIPEDAMEHMFDAYISDDDGVQLDVVKDIVTAHNGTISADANPGGGTIFIIELPKAGGANAVEDADVTEVTD